MKKFCIVILVSLVAAGTTWCAAVNIKGYGIMLITPSENGNTATVSDLYSFYSSDEIVSTNYPFLLTTNANFSPDPFITQSNYEQGIASRFLILVGIPETMITDSYYMPLLSGGQTLLYKERPFFDMIDIEVLNGLSDWSWDGSTGNPLGGTSLGSYGYTIPPATGTFNQTEQRFYVSDGRQYQVAPEPSALSLLAVGLGGLAVMRRRRS